MGNILNQSPLVKLNLLRIEILDLLLIKFSNNLIFF